MLFRKNHLADTKYKIYRGNKLVVPEEVSQNAMKNCLSEYLFQFWSAHLFRSTLVPNCDENRNNIDSAAYNKVTNFGIKRNAEDLLKRLKPFSEAVD